MPGYYVWNTVIRARLLRCKACICDPFGRGASYSIIIDQLHSCWHSSSLCRQVISSHETQNARYFLPVTTTRKVFNGLCHFNALRKFMFSYTLLPDFLRNVENIFAFSVNSRHWDGEDYWNPSSYNILATYPTQSVPWLLMSCRRKGPRH